jgi:hypothetical protein
MLKLLIFPIYYLFKDYVNLGSSFIKMNNFDKSVHYIYYF